jgi:hypothetical protein
LLLTETGAFAEVLQRWSFQHEGVEVAVELAADAVRLSVAGTEVDEDVRLGPEQTSWLGATAQWAGSSHAIEAVLGSSQGSLVCKFWVDAQPVGEHHSSLLRYPEPLQWATVRKRIWLGMLGRAAIQPPALLVGGLLGVVAALATPVPGHGLTAAALGVALWAGWQAGNEWHQFDLPYQRREAHLQGNTVLSEPVTQAQRWASGVYFALGAFLLLCSALGIVSLAPQTELGAASVLAACVVLALGVLAVRVLRRALQMRKPSLWPPATHTRREVLAQIRHSAEQLKAQATAEKLASMPPIEGVHLQPGPRGLRFCFDPGLTADTFAQLLGWLSQESIEFALFDALYPQVSDPGAYLSYRPMGEVWQMTLGNHGWTGGIYQVEPKVVCQQLANLYAKRELAEISLEKVAFFAHYSLESTEDNAEMSRRLCEIHGSSQAR